ncbi:MAG: glycosyltransferase [Chthonomonadetes bacterium]|nr:glycosyltransferase [Chthonomonadetes bacterium]
MSDKYSLLFIQPGVSWKSVPSIERMGLQLTRELKVRGYKITWAPILTKWIENEDSISLIRLARQEGFEVNPLILPRKYDIRHSVLTFHEYLGRLKCDVVCATGYKAGIITAFTPHKATIEVLRGWTGHTLQVRFYEFLDKLFLRKHDLVVAVSPTQREIAIRYGVAPERAWWIPNALDIERLPPAIASADWSEQIGLKSDSVLIGGVGRLSKEKGFDFLLRAFVDVHRAHPDTVLVIAGDGIERERLRRLAKRLDMELHARFLGEIPNGAQLISGLNLLVLPSLSEGMPNVVLEAFAYKTPVVATAVGGVPELVKDGETGWLVPPRNPHALAQAIRDALSNPEEARRRAENAYRHLLANFTVEKQVDKWEQALQTAVENWRIKRR